MKRAYSIPSHLTAQERFKLFTLAFDKEKILEIGSYVGASAACFGTAKDRDGKGKIYCIDTWQNDGMAEGKKETFQSFSENTKPFAKWIVPVKGFSTEVVEGVHKYTSTLNLLFIDGDHSYEGVKADWDTYQKFLKEGSVVIFHDSGWADGVKKVISEDVMPVVSSFDSLPNMWWGTIGRKV